MGHPGSLRPGTLDVFMRMFIHQANAVDNDKQYKPSQIKAIIAQTINA